MKQSVMIKSSKCGINLVLHPDLAFEELLEEILQKFQQSEKFFSDAEFAISFEGRDLCDEEKYQIVDAIMEHTKIKILCIIDNDEKKDELIRRKITEMEEAKQTSARALVPSQAIFYHGNLKAGDQLDFDETVIILGDVKKGATVISKSSIIVLGHLSGMAYAGMDGKQDSFIAALKFTPEQYNIAGIYGDPPAREKNSLFSKRSKATEGRLAYLSDGFIKLGSFS
ncbi:MAG: septum site-determining protein MinC [Clostridiales bacterium]|nr:septum site-determining protein MinC [Clostridiales bacterium]